MEDLTVAEYALKTGKSQQTVKRWLKAKKLEGYQRETPQGSSGMSLIYQMRSRATHHRPAMRVTPWTVVRGPVPAPPRAGGFRVASRLVRR